MNSSQIALAVLAAKGLVAALLVTAAQFRIVARPRQKPWHYALAWAVCAAVLGGLLTLTDSATGMGDAGRRAADLFLAAAVVALALIGGWAWTRRAAWAETGRFARFASLFAVHALIVVLAAWPLI